MKIFLFTLLLACIIYLSSFCIYLFCAINEFEVKGIISIAMIPGVLIAISIWNKWTIDDVKNSIDKKINNLI